MPGSRYGPGSEPDASQGRRKRVAVSGRSAGSRLVPGASTLASWLVALRLLLLAHHQGAFQGSKASTIGNDAQAGGSPVQTVEEGQAEAVWWDLVTHRAAIRPSPACKTASPSDQLNDADSALPFLNQQLRRQLPSNCERQHQRSIEAEADTLLAGRMGDATSYDFLFKVVLIGDSGVGKSCVGPFRSPNGPRCRIADPVLFACRRTGIVSCQGSRWR